MCGMRLMPQRIQEKNVQSFQLVERRVRNLAMVGEVGGGSEAKAVNFRLAVDQPYRFEARAKNFHRPVDRTQLQLRQPAEFVIGVENVAEHPAQKSRGVRARIKRQFIRLVTVTERAQI